MRNMSHTLTHDVCSKDDSCQNLGTTKFDLTKKLIFHIEVKGESKYNILLLENFLNEEGQLLKSNNRFFLIKRLNLRDSKFNFLISN